MLLHGWAGTLAGQTHGSERCTDSPVARCASFRRCVHVQIGPKRCDMERREQCVNVSIDNWPMRCQAAAPGVLIG